MAPITNVSAIKYSNSVEGLQIKRSILSPLYVERTFAEHEGGVLGLEILDDNRFITGSDDRSIKTWDKSSTNSLKTQYPDKFNRIWNLQLLSDRTCVALGWSLVDTSNEIRIYNLSNGKSHNLPFHRDKISSFALSKKGLLASGSFDWTAKIWEPFSSQLLHTYQSNAIILCVGFLPDEKTFVCGNNNGEIQFWEMTHTRRDDRKPDRVFQNPCKLSSLLVMANGNIATGSIDGVIRIWDPLETPQKALKRELKGHYGQVTALAERPDHVLISGSGDSTMILWNIDTEESWTFPKEHKGQIRAIAAFADKSVLTASFDGTVKLWTEGAQPQAKL